MSGSYRWFPVVFVAIVLLASGLRLWQLAGNPPSLYWEEVALGYDAYSILQTGKDHHGNPFPIVAFESFGDWKPSLYFYTLVPSIAVFGLSEFAVRLPAAISGIAIVVGMGLLVRLITELSQPAKVARRAWIWQLVAMVVTAISPWAIIFSRGAWEVNLATALILWGAVSFLWGIKKAQVSWFVFGTILLCLSLYAYHAARTVAPAVGLGLVITWFLFSKQSVRHFIQLKWRQLAMLLVVAVVLISPIAFSLGTQTNQRFNETNIFADLQLLQQSQKLQAEAGNTFLAKALYHRYVVYAQAVIVNALTHLHPSFLFVTGDVNVRHSTQFMGQLYHVEAIFLVLGLYILVKRYRKFIPLFVLWLGVGLLTVSVTKAVPHALRLLPTLPVWLTLIVWGIQEFYQESLRLLAKLDQKKLLVVGRVVVIALIVLVYTAEVMMFSRFYFFIYPPLYAHEFGDGYKQMVQAVTTLAASQPELPIVISRDKGRPAMYYWFYTQTDPRQVQSLNDVTPQDQGEFLAFKNVSFPLKTDALSRPAIVALPVDTFSLRTGQELDQTEIPYQIIYDAGGKPSWVVFEFK